MASTNCVPRSGSSAASSRGLQRSVYVGRPALPCGHASPCVAEVEWAARTHPKETDRMVAPRISRQAKAVGGQLATAQGTFQAPAVKCRQCSDLPTSWPDPSNLSHVVNAEKGFWYSQLLRTERKKERHKETSPSSEGIFGFTLCTRKGAVIFEHRSGTKEEGPNVSLCREACPSLALCRQEKNVLILCVARG